MEKRVGRTDHQCRCAAKAFRSTGRARSLRWMRIFLASCAKCLCVLYDEGMIYRGNRIVNWCPNDQTVLSDLEVQKDSASRESSITSSIRSKNGDARVTVATTRPETMLGDTAVAVNPNDERYRDLVGADRCCCRLPIVKFRSWLTSLSILSLAPARLRSRLLTIQTTTRWVCVTTSRRLS